MNSHFKFTCRNCAILVVLFIGTWVIAGCGKKMPTGPATCTTLCERLQDCNTLPDRICISGNCRTVHCMTDCNKFVAKVRQEVLDDLQVCIWSMSCSALDNPSHSAGYTKCLSDVYLHRSDFIAERSTTCEQLKSRAQTLCTSPECQNIQNDVWDNCRTWGAIATDIAFPEISNCLNELTCLTLKGCTEKFNCAFSLDGTKYCVASISSCQ